MSMRSCIVVVKLLKFMSGWSKLIHRESYLILTDILKWSLPWSWCRSCNF